MTPSLSQVNDSNGLAAQTATSESLGRFLETFLGTYPSFFEGHGGAESSDEGAESSDEGAESSFFGGGSHLSAVSRKSDHPLRFVEGGFFCSVIFQSTR